jgi:hypothetical protein
MIVCRRDFVAAVIGGSLGVFNGFRFNNSRMQQGADGCQYSSESQAKQLAPTGKLSQKHPHGTREAICGTVLITCT